MSYVEEGLGYGDGGMASGAVKGEERGMNGQ